MMKHKVVFQLSHAYLTYILYGNQGRWVKPSFPGKNRKNGKKKKNPFLALSLVSRIFFLKNEKMKIIGLDKQPQIEEDQDLLLLLLFAFISGI